jgi:hypothetical protein
MKKIIILLIVLLVLILISGYVENTYCRVWVTADTVTGEVRSANSFLCRINAYLALVGVLVLDLINK